MSELNIGQIDFGYELLDFGEGKRLERFGRYVVERFSVLAESFCLSDRRLWDKVDASFVPRHFAQQYNRQVSQVGQVITPQNQKDTEKYAKKYADQEDGQRGSWTCDLGSWVVDFGQMLLELRCTPFGHVGLFAEQLSNWAELSRLISAASICQSNRREVIRVLNLFAYTGGGSIAVVKSTEVKSTVSQSCGSQQNVEVVHVDSSRSVVEWAKRNAVLNGVSGVRFIVDDVRQFVRRELRRGRKYDVVILDPPTYGHGTKNETWMLSTDLPFLLADIAGLLTNNPIAVLLTAHTIGCDSDKLQKMLNDSGIKLPNIKKLQLNLTTKKGKSLPSGYGILATQNE
ncbi:MAG: class I SAM-dependent methyltransferase [Planctomycetaceae bacterium]|jgi:23S rRNA (cytosine1962-C5)-methyltransferase|nr:class I SAM-dependent methyltransferase [Planctomycetaceae bacterium]